MKHLTTTIIIHHYQFSVTQPYSPGPCHLSPGEASALNALRADLIRQSAAHLVRQSESASDFHIEGLLSPTQLQSIQGEINLLESRFSFKGRNGEPRKSRLQQELDALDPSMPTEHREIEARRRLAARSAAIDPTDLGL